MSPNWSDWAHVMWSTRGHWHPGDPRGFRDHDHRIHSSGDYKHPPPKGEHEGLHKYAKRIAHSTIRLTREQRQAAGERILVSLQRQRIPIRALSIGAMHAHALIRVGNNDARVPIGIAKQVASRALRNEFPGRMWGQRCHVVRITEHEHYRNVVSYILEHLNEGAWVWEPEKFRPPP